MDFKQFRDRMVKHFNEMTKDCTMLYEVDLDKDILWNLYLDSFPPGTNEIFRERREYDCTHCRHFFDLFANVVVIKDNVIHTIWEFDAGNDVYQTVLDALDKYVKSFPVSDVYVSKEKKIGTDHSLLFDEKTIRFDHFFIKLPDRFVNRSHLSTGDIKGQFRDVRNVFKRSLDEITEESILTVIELISSGSLYKGEEWKSVLEQFLRYKREYENTPVEQRDDYAWEKSVNVGAVIGKIKNHCIGTLLMNISENMDLELAVRKYEQIVAPSNYKRPKAIYTQKMLNDAKNTLTELGYIGSLSRRFSTFDDLTVNNILFSNKDVAKRISGNDIFTEMEKGITSNPKKFERVEEVNIEKFVNDILPIASELEVFLENKHTVNMVSLIAPQNLDCKSMFKWSNGFSWAYSGNLTDSAMRERVKSAGGKIDGVLRFSIQWNEDGKDNSDLDAHCIEPNKNEIYFCNCRKPSKSHFSGQLDVDIVDPKGEIAVENITWDNKDKMKPGEYYFFVKQYSGHTKNGFKAEIEFDGQIYSFNYNKPTKDSEVIPVAGVILHKDNSFSIKKILPSTMANTEIWGLHTNQFIPVSVVCYSPNYWDVQNGIGHKHYMFMLKGCANPEEPNGFFNEYLKEELMPYKRFMEVLGSKCHVMDCDDQLSGLGFSSTKRAELTVKVKGQTERVMKIKF